MPNAKRRKYAPLYHFFFLDILVSPRARPILLYAVVMVGIGAFLYRWLEGWSWLDAFYFVVITLTTIGYGDLHPTTSATKVITIFYALNGIVILLTLFDVIRRERVSHVANDAQRDFLQQTDDHE
jgi:voltage-gated potassium channel